MIDRFDFRSDLSRRAVETATGFANPQRREEGRGGRRKKFETPQINTQPITNVSLRERRLAVNKKVYAASSMGAVNVHRKCDFIPVRSAAEHVHVAAS